MISIEQLKMNEEFGWNEDSRATSREASNEAKKLLSKDRSRLFTSLSKLRIISFISFNWDIFLVAQNMKKALDMKLGEGKRDEESGNLIYIHNVVFLFRICCSVELCA